MNSKVVFVDPLLKIKDKERNGRDWEHAYKSIEDVKDDKDIDIYIRNDGDGWDTKYSGDIIPMEI